MLWKKIMSNLSSDPIVWENFSPTILEFELPEKCSKKTIQNWKKKDFLASVKRLPLSPQHF